jgi:hypothetical protein
MAIWVIKDGQREGPYEEQDVRELVYEGTYTDMDPAIRDGQFDWTTLGQVLGRQPLAPEPTPPVASETPPSPPVLPPELPVAEPPPAVPVAANLPAPELPQPAEPPRPVQVAVIDFEMPFGSMVLLMVKWVLASIPALLILGAIAGIFWIAFFALMAAVLHH